MYVITFLYICLEAIIFAFLLLYKLSRVEDWKTRYYLILIALLIIYNVTGGLLPDNHLPGSLFIQESIAYGTGFITPCFFPLYVYKVFDLKKMRFHAYRGVIYFLILPYLIFVFVYKYSGNILFAKRLLILPVLYGIWVMISLHRAIKVKYNNTLSSKAAREELIFLFISLTPWVGLPIIDYFDLGQTVEASVTNTGFLLLLALAVKNDIKQMRSEHLRFVESESRLRDENDNKDKDGEMDTNGLDKIGSQKKQKVVMLLNSVIQELSGPEEAPAADPEIEQSGSFKLNYKKFKLTSREVEIVLLMKKGLTSKNIAEDLFISENTVRKHIQNIFAKVDVSNKLELLHKLQEAG